MDEEILKWYGKHIDESGKHDVWIGDKDAFYRAAYNKGEESMRQQLAEAHKETDSVVYARDEAYRMLADMQEKCNVFQEKVFAMRDDLATMTAAYDEQITLHNKTLDELAECEEECLEEARLNGMGSEREAKLMAALAECERERDEARNQCVKCGLLDAAKEQLATVTKERDELVAALKNLHRDGVRSYYTIDALAKLGADKTGEGS